MRRDLVQQLKFDNAADLAAAVGVPLLSLLFTATMWLLEITGYLIDPELEDLPRLVSASWFCLVMLLGSVMVTLHACFSMQSYASRVLQRHFAAVEQSPTPVPVVAHTATAPESLGINQGLVLTPEQTVKDLALRFGQYCRQWRKPTARADFLALKTAFKTIVVLLWVLYPISMPNICPPPPSLMSAGLLLWTLSGYLAFNMGYRYGVRRALLANLNLLGVAPASGAASD